MNTVFHVARKDKAMSDSITFWLNIPKDVVKEICSRKDGDMFLNLSEIKRLKENALQNSQASLIQTATGTPYGTAVKYVETGDLRTEANEYANIQSNYTSFLKDYEEITLEYFRDDQKHIKHLKKKEVANV